MLLHESRLIRTYLRIIATYHQDPWTIGDFDAIHTLYELLGSRKGITRYLGMSTINEDKKYELIMKAITHIDLQPLFKPLLQLLALQHRIFLFPRIVQSLVHTMQKSLRIELVTIASSHPLSSADQKTVEDWIAHKQNATYIRISNAIRPQLIAGIRIEGATFMGDYSVLWQLQKLQRTYLQEGLSL